jgi:hypothetical protein
MQIYLPKLSFICMTGVEEVSTVAGKASTSAALGLALFAVLLYTALLVLVIYTKQFGVGYCRSETLCIKAVSPTLAAGMNIAIHIGLGGSLLISMFSERWTSSAYWLSIGISLVSALWVAPYPLLQSLTE